MIDIHSHVLHDIDDGSKNLESSLILLKKAEKQGVKKIVMTPHLKTTIYEPSSEIISKRFNELKKKLLSEKIDIEIFKGREILIEDIVIEKIISERMTLGNSDYMLIETHRDILPEKIFTWIYSLLSEQIRPILAHPERYLSIIKKPENVKDFINKNVYIQINAGSLFNFYGSQVRKTAWKLLEKGWVHFIASDSHCNSDYFMERAYTTIQNKIDTYTADLLLKKNPEKVINNEYIELQYVEEDDFNYSELNFIQKMDKYLTKIRNFIK